MKTKLFHLSLIILFWASSSGLVYRQNGEGGLTCKYQKINDLEIPKLKPHESVIRHTGYTLSFNEKYKEANWVAYELTREETHGDLKRTNHFRPDPEVTNGTATDEDYKYSGYDRGIWLRPGI